MHTHVGYPVTSWSEHRDVSVVQSTLAIFTWLLSSLLNVSASCSHVGARRLQCPHLKHSIVVTTGIWCTSYYACNIFAPYFSFFQLCYCCCWWLSFQVWSLKGREGKERERLTEISAVAPVGLKPESLCIENQHLTLEILFGL